MALENWSSGSVVKSTTEPLRFSPLDDIRSLQFKIEKKSPDLFKSKLEEWPLQVTRVFRERDLKSGGRDITRFQVKKAIKDVSEAERWREDSLQIFTIRQDRSWTTLNIDRPTFERLLSLYNVMPGLWRHIFTFGRKSEENEFLFPGFSSRRSRRKADSTDYESVYTLRRVEENGRDGVEGGFPWSVRQTTVYHKFSITRDSSRKHTDILSKTKISQPSKSTLVLVAPSPNAEWAFSNCLDQNHRDQIPLSPWNIHRILIADSLPGWVDYMAYLESRLKEQSDQIVLATVGCKEESLSPLLEFNINFEDRQELKIIEDKVLDLRAILSSKLSSISSVKDTCKLHAVEEYMSTEQRYDIESISLEFEQYVEEAKLLVDRAKSLFDKAKSTATLLSDLLSYEEAVSLKRLQQEAQAEGQAMSVFTEQNSRDAAAVKVLTVITLVYLPTTIVANFFSTQFVQTQVDGRMKVSKDVWLLVAISVPLTCITVFIWWFIVYLTRIGRVVSPEDPRVMTVQRQNSLHSLMSSKKKSRDLESEGGLSRNSTLLPFWVQKPQSSWSSTATTVK